MAHQFDKNMHALYCRAVLLTAGLQVVCTLSAPTCRYGEGEALRHAAEDGMHWLLHLDPDELLHPGELYHSVLQDA